MNNQQQDGCYYHIDESQVFRVKHILSYFDANRQSSSLISSLTKEDITYKDRIDQIQITPDCVIADGTDLGKKTTIKRTIIGKNCRIDEKCKIIDCVIFDHVQIKEGLFVHSSLIHENIFSIF